MKFKYELEAELVEKDRRIAELEEQRNHLLAWHEDDRAVEDGIFDAEPWQLIHVFTVEIGDDEPAEDP